MTPGLCILHTQTQFDEVTQSKGFSCRLSPATAGIRTQTGRIDALRSTDGIGMWLPGWSDGWLSFRLVSGEKFYDWTRSNVPINLAKPLPKIAGLWYFFIDRQTKPAIYASKLLAWNADLSWRFLIDFSRIGLIVSYECVAPYPISTSINTFYMCNQRKRIVWLLSFVSFIWSSIDRYFEPLDEERENK